MSNHFLDTSGLVKHYHPEVGTPKVDFLWATPGARLFLSRLGVVETVSVFAGSVQRGSQESSGFLGTGLVLIIVSSCRCPLQRGVVMAGFSTRDCTKQSPVQPDRTSYWMERKKDVRAQLAVRSLTPEEQQAADDETWALHDAAVQATYRGQFVVPFARQIVAHELDPEQVLEEAARATGRSIEELPLVGIDDPLLDVPH